jgi:hypothetical protein
MPVPHRYKGLAGLFVWFAGFFLSFLFIAFLWLFLLGKIITAGAVRSNKANGNMGKEEIGDVRHCCRGLVQRGM